MLVRIATNREKSDDKDIDKRLRCLIGRLGGKLFVWSWRRWSVGKKGEGQGRAFDGWCCGGGTSELMLMLVLL